jgi:hypothetical protein
MIYVPTYALACLAIALIASLGINTFLLIKAKKTPKPSYTAEMLMHDLTRGQAVIRIERVAPEDIFLRSPKSL